MASAMRKPRSKKIIPDSDIPYYLFRDSSLSSASIEESDKESSDDKNYLPSPHKSDNNEEADESNDVSDGTSTADTALSDEEPQPSTSSSVTSKLIKRKRPSICKRTMTKNADVASC